MGIVLNTASAMNGFQILNGIRNQRSIFCWREEYWGRYTKWHIVKKLYCC